jgi:hypothetical protein
MVIDFEKSKRFRELMRQSIVLEQDIHAKLDLLHQVNVGLGVLCVELLHGQDLPGVKGEADQGSEAEAPPAS